MFLQEFFNQYQLLSISLPRRFGKTIMLTTVKDFFGTRFDEEGKIIEFGEKKEEDNDQTEQESQSTQLSSANSARKRKKHIGVKTGKRKKGNDDPIFHRFTMTKIYNKAKSFCEYKIQS